MSGDDVVTEPLVREHEDFNPLIVVIRRRLAEKAVCNEAVQQRLRVRVGECGLRPNLGYRVNRQDPIS